MVTVYTDDSGQNSSIVTDSGIVDTQNSTTALLGAGGVYTGNWAYCLDHSQIQVMVFADQPAAALGLSIQFSSDGVNVDHVHQYEVIANEGETVQVHVHTPYFRVVYTNGATPQTVFRLQTILRPVSALGTVLEVDDVPSNYDDALLTKSIITGFSPVNNSFVDVKTTTDGALAINQNTEVDASNSSTANLAGGAIFVGATVSDLNYTAVQYMLNTDQNCMVYVDQSPDGTNWDIVDSFNHYVSSGGSGNTIQLVGSFYRIRVQNITATTTTYFRLQVIKVPFLPSIPRSLNQYGHLKVHSYGFEDLNGFNALMTPHGEITIAPTIRLVGSQFTGGVLDSNFWTSSLGTGGSITPDGQITINTGTTANNSVSLQSMFTARYVSGQGLRFRSVLRIPDIGVANNTRTWGAFTATDGCFFELRNGLFRVATRKNSVTTYVDNGSFNGILGVSHLSDLPHIHTYEIVWNSLNVFFFLDGLILHTVTASSAPWSGTQHLPVRFENTNTGGNTTNVAMEVRNGAIERNGQPLTQSTSKYVTGLNAGTVLKYAPGNLHGVILSGITNNSVVTFYDNTAASGTVLWSSGPLTSNGLPFYLDMKGISFSTGLTITITGAALNVLTMYE